MTCIPKSQWHFWNNMQIQSEALRKELETISADIRMMMAEPHEDAEKHALAIIDVLRETKHARARFRDGAYHLRIYFVTSSCTAGNWPLLRNWLAAADRRIVKLLAKEEVAVKMLTHCERPAA